MRFFQLLSGTLEPVHEREESVYKFKKTVMVADCALAEMLRDRIRQKTHPYFYLQLGEVIKFFLGDVRFCAGTYLRKGLMIPKREMSKLVGKFGWK